MSQSVSQLRGGFEYQPNSIFCNSELCCNIDGLQWALWLTASEKSSPTKPDLCSQRSVWSGPKLLHWIRGGCWRPRHKVALPEAFPHSTSELSQCQIALHFSLGSGWFGNPSLNSKPSIFTARLNMRVAPAALSPCLGASPASKLGMCPCPLQQLYYSIV